MIGIYKITSPSGNIYIGQSRDVKKRIRRYGHHNKIHHQVALYNSFNKYGAEAHTFEIIHEMPITATQLQINYAEVFFWKLYSIDGNQMLNIREPGSSGKIRGIEAQMQHS